MTNKYYFVTFGGWNGSERLDDIYVFDIWNNKFTKLQKKIPQKLDMLTCAVINGIIHLIGGGDTQGNRVKTHYHIEAKELCQNFEVSVI